MQLGLNLVFLHAGRLNVLANVVRKPLRQIFSEFAGVTPESEGGEWSGTGDVKYHLGTSYDRPTTSGKRVHLSLLANPSHLEVRLRCISGGVYEIPVLGLGLHTMAQSYLGAGLKTNKRKPVVGAKSSSSSAQVL